jgi:hypothetical protein
LNDTCRICGVKMTFSLGSEICVMCEWQLDKGHTEEEIKKMVEAVKVRE